MIRHQPDLIQRKLLQSLLRKLQMTVMNRIKAAA
jgi:hypothetical protein